MLNSFIIFKNKLIKFCQIHQIDVSPKTLKRRINKNVKNSNLHRNFFLTTTAV